MSISLAENVRTDVITLNMLKQKVRKYTQSLNTAVIAGIMNKSKELIKSPKYYITGIKRTATKYKNKNPNKTTAFQTATTSTSPSSTPPSLQFSQGPLIRRRRIIFTFTCVFTCTFRTF